MKLSVKKLIDACDAVILAHQNNVNLTDEAFESYRKQQADNWIAERGDDWRRVNRLISKRLREGQPIIRDDVSLFGTKCFIEPIRGQLFKLDGVTYNSPRADGMADLARGIKSFLLMCDEDTVTLSQLKQTNYYPEQIAQIIEVSREGFDPKGSQPLVY